MGGMRTAGDLVARMQMTRRMRLKEAKRYVADKLSCTPHDLSDPIGHGAAEAGERPWHLGDYVDGAPDEPGMMEAKFNIARLLDVPINCVERFRRRAHL